MSVREDEPTTVHSGTSVRKQMRLRGIKTIMGSAAVDAAAAELILAMLAERTGRPAHLIADDLVYGRPFKHRPSWL